MIIAGEFIKQIILVVFYIAVLVLAVKLGISFAKKKNLKNAEKESE